MLPVKQTWMATLVAVTAFGCLEASAQVGHYQPCIDKPVFALPLFELPVMAKPVFETSVIKKPTFEPRTNDVADFVRPVFDKPKFERPVFENCRLEKIYANGKAKFYRVADVPVTKPAEPTAVAPQVAAKTPASAGRSLFFFTPAPKVDDEACCGQTLVPVDPQATAIADVPQSKSAIR